MKKSKYKHNERKRKASRRHETSSRSQFSVVIANLFAESLLHGSVLGDAPRLNPFQEAVMRNCLQLLKALREKESEFSGTQNVRKENVRSIPKDGVDYGTTSSDKG